jgi:hypothetical protein
MSAWYALLMIQAPPIYPSETAIATCPAGGMERSGWIVHRV